MRKKVVLLGDSIRLLGYGERVAELLMEGNYEVFQPQENCRFVKFTLRGLWDWRKSIDGCDVVHWNNGLWDTCIHLYGDGIPFTELNEYVENMVRVAKILKKMSKRVIFATTTPVVPDCEYHENNVIEQYNAAVVPKLQELGVEINDLNKLVKENLSRYICEDKVHLSKEGSEVCAKQVFKCITQTGNCDDK